MVGLKMARKYLCSKENYAHEWLYKTIEIYQHVNVCIHDFDDVKEESNKAASNDKHLLQE